MSENNDTSNESNSLGSDSILQSSRLGGGGASSSSTASRVGVLRPSVLAPSVLGATSNNDKPALDGNLFNIKEKLDDQINPFKKDHENDEEDEEEGAVGGISKKETISNNDKKTYDDDEPDDRPDPLKMLRKNGLERANIFAAAKNSIPRVEKSGFVFGENVHERVLSDNINSEKPETSNKPNDLLFSSVIQNAAKTIDSDGAKEDAEVKSLTEVAREYEESRAQKRKYEEVKTFTGEENELNVIDINCKLFAFENSNWEERGRGSLRLNDTINEEECSRVVFRTAGNLRLLLNTKIWAGMVAEQPSEKSLRLTAMDNTGKIKVFLIMARPMDIIKLHVALVVRINARQSSHPDETGPPQTENNGSEVNNANIETETEKAATVAEPDPDELPEPSPKKSLTVAAEN